MKRCFDELASAFGLLLSAPLLVVLIPLIRLTSSGPAIFRQPRVGRDGKVFLCYKLRTMAVNTRQAGTHEISADSITGIGRILRKTKIDELPQLWNVLKGEMSLVGPRPCLPGQAELIRERGCRGVFMVRPGITGLGQVRGIDMSDPIRLADCDAEYVANRSFAFDLRLIWLTISGAGMGDRVNDAGAVGKCSHRDENTKKNLP
ncbi:MAG: sugar transferase [Verrucomicrobiales bacterium]|nr:sugar transferase [Verrucomicrobiales bacterium]